MITKKKAGLLLAVCMLCLCMVTACSTKKRQHSGETTATDTPVRSQSLTGVVIAQDTKQQKITMRELDSNLETILYYDATAVVTDKFQETIAADQIAVGQILQAEYRASDTLLVSAAVPEDVWEYDEVGTFSFRGEENMMRFAGEKYQYSTNTYIASGDQPIEMMELNGQDKLTVRGVGFKVYSIVRTAGHGYIRLANYQDFIGGMVEVGNQIILPITDNMLITAQEGMYRLTLCKGAAVTSKTITVQQDKEVIADFSDYVPAVENIGMMTFIIEPDGADLTINGTKVDYSQPVALNYGEYSIAVSMTGYDTYTGTLDVENPSREVNIDLIEAEASVDKSSATASPSPTGETDSGSTVTKKVDSKHMITVTGPRGAEVYLDNVYKGLAPCKFKKVIGSQTITLSRTGYVTKSYAVDIMDDDEDVTLSFAELVKEKDANN